MPLPMKKGYAYCMSCRKERKIVEAKTVTKKGRKFTKGYCSYCDSKVSRTGEIKKSGAQKAAIKATKTNIDSEENFISRLKKRLGRNSLVFSTGKAKGVPDIVTYSHDKLGFYEIKPVDPGNQAIRRGSLSNLDSSFLKEHQKDWIAKNCLNKKSFSKKISAYIVFYLKTKNGKYKYCEKKLNKGNLRKYSRLSRESTREKILTKLLDARKTAFS